MLADKELLKNLLQYIGERLRHEVEGLLIGGNAMLFYGLRGQTKDMDLVFFDKREIDEIVRIIKNHPLFKKSKITEKLPYEVNPELLRKGEPIVIQNGDIPRFDLFYRYVFSIDAKKIFQESKKTIYFDLMKLRLAEPEHMIFLKGVTGRPLDQEDIVRLVKELEVNWEYFLELVKNYNKDNKKVTWLLLGNLYDINREKEIIPKFVLEEIAKIFGIRF